MQHDVVLHATGDDDGRKLAANINDQLASEISTYVDSGKRPPGLAVILVGHDPASEVYVAHKERACAKIGIQSRKIELQEG